MKIDYKGIDKEIIPWIKILNYKKGIRTFVSCAGHIKGYNKFQGQHNIIYPYLGIEFDTDELYEEFAIRFLNLHRSFVISVDKIKTGKNVFFIYVPRGTIRSLNYEEALDDLACFRRELFSCVFDALYNGNRKQEYRK